MHGAFGMAKKPPPPVAPPPKKGKKAPPPPPPPPPKKAPPAKKKAPPPPPPKKAPPAKKKAPPPQKPTKAPPAKKSRRQRPKKEAKPKKPTKKARKIRIKLGLRQTRLRKDDEETIPEDIGWTISQETLEDFDQPESTEPEAVSHQCSMCGSIMQIPAPKRDRYKVVCAYPECGHEDTFGL